MRTIFSISSVAALLVALGLMSTAMASTHNSCEAATLSITVTGEMSEYDLIISSTLGGSVHATFDGQEEMIGPGETQTVSSVLAGTMVALVADPQENYRFANWVGDVDTITSANAAETTITLDGHYSITASFDGLPPQAINWILIGGILVPIVVGLVIYLVRRKGAAERKTPS